MILAGCKLWPLLPVLPEKPPSEITFLLDDVPPLALYASYLACDQRPVRRVIQTYATRWRHVLPSISGHDLRARGLPPGPIYKQLLSTLRAAWLDGEIGTAEEEAAMIEKVLREAR